MTTGPLANARRMDAMDSFVNDAKDRGGKIITGGQRRGNQGYFYEPTVITDLPDDCKLMTQEPFGPLAPVVPFKTMDEVVERANSLPYGLAAYAFTGSAQTANLIGDALQSGMVGVNSVSISTPETPFGGIKESGHGSEGGLEGLQAYLNTKFAARHKVMRCKAGIVANAECEKIPDQRCICVIIFESSNSGGMDLEAIGKTITDMTVAISAARRARPPSTRFTRPASAVWRHFCDRTVE